MQIRLTVVDPQGPHPDARGRAASCDVLVTAPAGTALAAVASALAAAVCGEGAASSSSAVAVVLYAGVERLDTQRCTLGEPPLIDGAVLSLGGPADPEPHPEVDDAPARLHVVAGPDAGGVHLLHGGQVRVGRSADADVPLDDPDVSRLHCAVTLSPDGRLTVADLGSTNGTTLDGTRVQGRPVRLTSGALLRIGESALRLAPPGGPGPRVATTPDGEGHVRVPCGGTEAGAGGDRSGAAIGPTPGTAGTTRTHVPGGNEPTGTATDGGTGIGTGTTGTIHARVTTGSAPTTGGPGSQEGPSGPTSHAHGTVEWSGSADARGERGRGSGETPLVPGQGTAPRLENRRGGGEARAADDGPRTPPGAVSSGGASGAGGGAMDVSATHGGRSGLGSFSTADDDVRGPHASHTPQRPSATSPASPYADSPASPYADSHDADSHGAGASRRKGTPLRGTDVPPGVRKRGGLSAWARRLAGGRGGDQETAAPGSYDDEESAGAESQPSVAPPPAPETWPDPAALLLTALGPGPRLWERGPGHPEALTVRLGTADRAAPDGSGLLPAVPVTAGLREVGALGLAGPRPRLSGLARAVLAQLAALHSPDALEVVLISTDRARSEEERVAEWSWLGWLPHLRPGHGQDCRLLLAYDRDQATARTDELLRRLEDHLSDSASGAGPAQVPPPRDNARRPSWAVADDIAGGGFPGPYTVVVVDGDPGGADLREAVSRLAVAGPRAGIHVVCLAETPAASPSSPTTATYETACAVAPTFRACGAVALLGGDVATALRLLRVARAGAQTERPGPVGPGTVGAVDAVSLAWAERFARALAPLRPDGADGGERPTRVSAPLPQSARLLDELGLARATPASLMARWADAADDAEALGGRARAVLGAGPRGPVGVDLAAEGPHLLIEGPTGSGRTELLRAVVASLAAAERPDRLGIILLDGRDTVGKGSGGPGDGLRVCTDVPHVTTHLTANDPVRMREFAQSLSAELKRRAELLGRSDFAEWHTHRAVSGRIVPQRTPNTAPPGTGPGGTTATGAADLEAPPSTTLRLRPGAAARQRTETASPLPRLVVVVDDLDALVSPALGSPGRPAAGSVMRALEAVAREGERLGVHLVAAAGPGGRTAESEPARLSTVRIALDPPGSGADEPAPGRGRLKGADGRLTPFQGGRVTGRIPRTATLRPTVVPLEWLRMGDPPTRRPVRELGNGPTDLALLASALERAARHPSPTGVH
ncbi:FHA domain-containing protein [Streptomyces sp. NBC_01235]|uniref:FHA domain-containing protein n=1 Tax=Streptomyces sp. NBC_01235 TaxID=2903788 RepID=UPI002E14F94A|nr:FHA domain-containing protein [Streptomyces sp. NBC_01235]